MKSQEILFRLKQEGINLCFWMFGRRITPVSDVAAARGMLADPAPVFERLRGTAFAREVERIATCVVEHRFPLLTFAEVCTGPHIDWQRDPLRPEKDPGWRRFAPPRLVPYLDFQRVGDHKLVWELNRHQHLPLLAQAWRFTGRREFLEEIGREIASWRSANPMARGLNWASSLEVAFRALSWIWVWRFAAGDLPPATRSDLLAGIEEHAWFLEYNLSSYFSPNTHLLGEALALEAAGVLFPGFPRAERWRRLGAETLDRELYTQVREDGSYFEQSTYYHVYALDMFLLHFFLSERPADDALRERLGRMACFLAAVMGASRRLPMLGDDDGGRLFHPYGRRDEFGRATLTTCGILLDQPHWVGSEAEIAEQAAWWMGASALDAPGAEPGFESRCFPDGGVAVMAAGDVQVVIDAGQFGEGSGGHSHADTLSVLARQGSDEILIDPGTYTYVANPQERDRFRGTAAHNTIRIDGLDQARAVNPFRWEQKPEVEMVQWETSAARDVLAAVCRYRGFTHARAAMLVKPDVLVICDRVDGPAGEHWIEQFWHLGVPLGQAGLVFEPGAEVEVSEGGEYGWRSPGLGTKEPATVVRLARRVALPTWYWTALDFSRKCGLLTVRHGGAEYRRGGTAFSIQVAVTPGGSVRFS
jgi:hypothetical protein